MQIESIKHKALKKLVTNGDRRIMEPDRLTDMIAFINAAVTFDHLSIPPNFGLHALTGQSCGRLWNDGDEELAANLHQG